ncbi:MAG: hypothetical protein AMXMBFR33_65410 [Candidatus Xenobia bacterium]
MEPALRFVSLELSELEQLHLDLAFTLGLEPGELSRALAATVGPSELDTEQLGLLLKGVLHRLIGLEVEL